MMKKGKKKKKKKDLTRLWTLSSLSGKKRKKKRSRKKATARFNRMIATANRSITLGDLKNAEEILLELAQTERWSEHRRHVHSSLALIYEEQKRYKEALHHFWITAKMSTNKQTRARKLLSVAEMAKHCKLFKEEIVALSSALRNGTNNFEAYKARYKARIKIRDHVRAFEDLDVLIKKYPDNLQISIHYGTESFWTGKKAKGYKHLKKLWGRAELKPKGVLRNMRVCTLYHSSVLYHSKHNTTQHSNTQVRSLGICVRYAVWTKRSKKFKTHLQK